MIPTCDPPLVMIESNDDSISDDCDSITAYSLTDSEMSYQQHTTIPDAPSTTPVISLWFGNPIPSPFVVINSSKHFSDTVLEESAMHHSCQV